MQLPTLLGNDQVTLLGPNDVTLLGPDEVSLLGTRERPDALPLLAPLAQIVVAGGVLAAVGAVIGAFTHNRRLTRMAAGVGLGAGSVLGVVARSTATQTQDGLEQAWLSTKGGAGVNADAAFASAAQGAALSHFLSASAVGMAAASGLALLFLPPS